MDDELARAGERYMANRSALEEAHRALKVTILEARQRGLTLRAIARLTGLSFARIYQITKEASRG